MPLNDAAADAVAADIAAELQALPRGEEQSSEALQIVVRKIFAGIVANAAVVGTTTVAGGSSAGIHPTTGTVT